MLIKKRINIKIMKKNQKTGKEQIQLKILNI